MIKWTKLIFFRWWQIYTGDMMAIPLSAIRKYTPEIIALSVVAVVLGAFWSIIDTYQPSYLLDLKPSKTNVTMNSTDSEIDLSQSLDAPSELSKEQVEIYDEFAIGAPKVIKFVLTGEFKKHIQISNNSRLSSNPIHRKINLCIFFFWKFHLLQLLQFQPFLYCGMLNGLLIIVAMQMY